MEEWFTLFKSNPLMAIGTVLIGGGAYLLKNRQEKSVDNREVARLQAAIEATVKDRDEQVDRISKERDEANDRADAAFAKQLELTERFSEMRAQNERLLERMEQVSKQVAIMAEDNAALRDEVKQLTAQNRSLSDQVSRLQSTIDSGAH